MGMVLQGEPVVGIFALCHEPQAYSVEQAKRDFHLVQVCENRLFVSPTGELWEVQETPLADSIFVKEGRQIAAIPEDWRQITAFSQLLPHLKIR